MVVRSKYGAIKTVCKTKHKHASRKEARRCDDLTLLEKAGEISGLVQQPRHGIRINGQKVCDYVADFSYWENGEFITEDVKGVKTSTYRLKKKLMKVLYAVDIRET